MRLCSFADTQRGKPPNKEIACLYCERPMAIPQAADIARVVRACEVLDLTKRTAESLLLPTRVLPGTLLAHKLATLGFKKKLGCDCVSEANQMNAWGLDGCREHLDEIVGWLSLSASQENLQIPDAAIRAFVEAILDTESQQPVKPPPEARILLRMQHGLGDHVKLVVLVKHLQHYFPWYQIEVASHNKRIYEGLCPSHSFRGYPDKDKFAAIINVGWEEPTQSFGNHPSTFIEKVLRRTYGVEPLEELCTYSLHPTAKDAALATEFLAAHCNRLSPEKFKAVVLHYEGNSHKAAKDLPHDTVAAVIDEATAAGYTVVLLDWNRRSPHIGRKGVVNPGRGCSLWASSQPCDPLVLAALIEHSAAFFGIDSGPSYIAGATKTPSLWSWTGYHPVNQCHLIPTAIHVVPDTAEQLLRGDEAAKQAGSTYFQKRYHHAFAGADQTATLARLLVALLANPEQTLKAYAPAELLKVA